MTDRELVARIAASAGPKGRYKQLIREFGLGGGRERRLLLEQLARLTVRGQLTQLDREHWSLPGAIHPFRQVGTRDNLTAGRLDLHRDGYGFVRPNRRSGAGAALQQTAPTKISSFLPTRSTPPCRATRCWWNSNRPKPMAACRAALFGFWSAANPTVVGTFHYARSDRDRRNIVVPFDERMTQPIVIPPGAEIPPAASTPHRVLGTEAAATPKHRKPRRFSCRCRNHQLAHAHAPAQGRVIEVLGSPDDFGVDVEMMIRKHQLPRIFPEHVLAEARSVAHLDPAEAARRADFRSLPIVTIDGETARDFDDAVLVRERANGAGYELQVHIADVAEYVRPGSALDLEARLRGTSVYFPDRAIPMLPQELSTDICSLRPNQDRLVLSCIMQLDAAGRIESFEIVEGIIRSAARMTYTEVTAILDAGDAPDQDAGSA